MAVNIDKEDLKAYLQLCNEKVVKNVEIVTKKDLGTSHLFHIAMDKRKVLVPNISKRAEPHEDNTLPRVHVGANLEDCMIGYNGILDLVLNNPVMKKGDEPMEKEHVSQADYLGGFYIHAIDYEVALKPNHKLVPQVKESNELWLVPYCRMRSDYEAEIIGKMIIKRLDFNPVAGGLPEKVVTIVMELKSDTPLVISPKITLNKGCWEIKVRNDRVTTHRPIAKDEFGEVKVQSASMLSMEDHKKNKLPRFLQL